MLRLRVLLWVRLRFGRRFLFGLRLWLWSSVGLRLRFGLNFRSRRLFRSSGWLGPLSWRGLGCRFGALSWRRLGFGLGPLCRRRLLGVGARIGCWLGSLPVRARAG